MSRLLIAGKERCFAYLREMRLDKAEFLQEIEKVDSAGKALRRLEADPPEILLFDYDLLEQKPPAILQSMRFKAPQCNIVIVHTHEELPAVIHRNLAEIGIVGFLPLHGINQDTALDCLRQIHSGMTNQYLTPDEHSRLDPDFIWLEEREPLTRKPLEVLKLLKRPMPPKMVAKKLEMERSTVDSHIRKIYAFFGIKSKKDNRPIDQLRHILANYQLEELLTAGSRSVHPRRS